MSGEMEENIVAEDEQAVVSYGNRGTRSSLPQELWRKSIAPVKSLKRVNLTNAAGQFLLFGAKVAALEAVRRISQARFRPLWWGLQGIFTIQAPPFNWLQRWSPFQHIAQATQSFSKPLVFLSIATAVASAIEEVRHATDESILDNLRALDDTPHHDHSDSEDSEEAILPTDQRALTMHLLKEELEDKGITLPERMDADELGRFLVAANGNVSNFISKVKKTVQWRERHHIFSATELKRWEHLVYWHGRDAQGRPTLIIRLGLAYTVLDPADHPGFAQAVVSQVEAGVLKLVVDKDDPTITVVMDCECENTVGFPLERLKSRIRLLQDHYPCRLASLLVVNLPPEMRGFAQEVLQILSPVTQKKVHLKGYRRYMGLLAVQLGPGENVPPFLGGRCKCQICSSKVISEEEQRRILERQAEARQRELEDAGRAMEIVSSRDPLSAEQSYTSTLRLLILGFVIIWIMVAMVAGHGSPKSPLN
ncbi:hypothetical protein M758_10G031400 [Ceratodon purpureus]|uniref:CRAL-TRIO domain-containing protein n=1 Tax=Ceratodon purpureus TaxID=3225 RepID=A0A8T0GNA9_CERPU|nr:hypothetical protein KC19_10G033900 [Ceratodon purpureus]KAG0602661.1 hypothetical protein M758_10G031400 [Ceratodon purpureus]